MTELYRWMLNAISKGRRWEGPSRPPPTFLDMPVDVFMSLCEWLSVRDILVLRMTSKRLSANTRIPTIWLRFLRKLVVPLPILPATSKNRFGSISKTTYEWLMRRALYLEQNWRRVNPVGHHSRFQAFGRTILMKLLPGGKYMVSVIKELSMERYTLVLWDLDQDGHRVPLTGVISTTPFLKVEVTYSMVKGRMSIVVAFAKPPAKRNEGDVEPSSQVLVLYTPISVLEEVASTPKDSKFFGTPVDVPFLLLHEAWTTCSIGQLALETMDNELVLLVVHRPRSLIFHYLNSGQRGNLLLGPVIPFGALRNSIWSVKLLPSQNSVIVSRVLVEVGADMDSTLFVLDLYLLPGPGRSYKYPDNMGRQMITGLHIDGFYFSDLETSWFNSLHDKDGLIPAPSNLDPPPLSIFMTTKQPRGFVHCFLPPVPMPNRILKLPYGRGWTRRYYYELPAAKVERHIWDDDFARPVILPGAFRSIIFLRPHLRPELQKEGSATAGAMETLRVCVYTTKAEGYNKFASPRTPLYLSTDEGMMEPDATQVEEEVLPVAEEAIGQSRLLRIPAIPNDIASKMMHGTTAVAFDESIGKLCVGTTGDTDIHILDFGGENWEVPVVL